MVKGRGVKIWRNFALHIYIKNTVILRPRANHLVVCLVLQQKFRLDLHTPLKAPTISIIGAIKM